ncbi:MAG: type II CAAX endopeptidase family protein [Myxococcota bacterium]|nr:type II CAAX endopeptidase family protein [Myxococcota bacterium]
MTQHSQGSAANPERRSRIFRELIALWLGTLLLIRAVVELQAGAGAPDWVLAAVPLLFIYAPVALCRWRSVDSWSYQLSIPAFSDAAAWRAVLSSNVRLLVWIGPAFALGYHLYQTQIFGFEPGHGWPADPLTIVAYQLFFVAIPEEFFYRGYFQTRLNECFERRASIFGVRMGWGSVWASLFFAFGHTLVLFQWWHFATFFPGMVFAWLREKTGGVMAGSVFHAVCNIAVIHLDTHYGIISG